MLTIVTRADVDCGDACGAPGDWNGKMMFARHRNSSSATSTRTFWHKALMSEGYFAAKHSHGCVEMGRRTLTVLPLLAPPVMSVM